MKRLIWTFVASVIFLGSFAQRYEVWIGTSDNNRKLKGNLGFSNDTVLMTYSNASLLFPSKEKYFTWDDITDLKIRNKSRNQAGQLIGTGAGILAWSLLDKSLKKSGFDWGLGGIYAMITVPVFLGSGALTGHLVTRKKIYLPLSGMSSEEKNQLLKSKVKRKN